jgi:hypothetical protein
VNDRLNASVGRVLGSLTQRRYLLGVILAWVLVVYLASGPSPVTLASGPSTASSGPSAGATSAAVPGTSNTLTSPASVATMQAASPAASYSSAPAANPQTAAVGVAPTGPSFGTPPVFSPPGAAPEVPQMSCPYPLPQAQNPPISSGVILSFLGPITELQGPFASYGLPTLGAIEPLVPMVTPVVSISQPVLNEITPNLSTLITDLVYLEDRLGLNSPEGAALAKQFEPTWLKLLAAVEPAEQALASTTAAQCLTLFGNELAQQAAKLNLTLPPLPLLPPIPGAGSAGGTPTGAAADSSAGAAAGTPTGAAAGTPTGSADTVAADAVADAVLSDSPSPFSTVSLAWSGGMPSRVVGFIRSLVSRDTPVILQLIDSPPPGAVVGASRGGFADFVAEAVHDLAGVSAFEVVVPSSSTASASDAVHGLAAADYARQPGQLIGLVVPSPAIDGSAAGFWQAFANLARGWQPNLVDFVAAPLTASTVPSLAAGVASAVGQASWLEREWSLIGKVPSDVPLFGTVALPPSVASSTAGVRQAIAAYEAALRPLHLGVLGLTP